MENRINHFTNEIIDKLVSESDCSMNSLSIKMELSYVMGLVDVNWSDIYFAIKNRYFDNTAAIEYATVLLGNDENNDKVMSLAVLKPNEISREELLQEFIIDFVKGVSEKEKRETENKIMYALLNLLYENKDAFDDPFKAIEIIYDDFGFPKTIENFVPYMQIEDDLTSVNAKEKLIENWKGYLHNQKKIWN